MVKINEWQYEVGKISTGQERYIEYSSWSKYIADILCSPRIRVHELAYPSLPRNTKVDKVIMVSDDILVVQYYHPFIQKWVRHVAQRKEDI